MGSALAKIRNGGSASLLSVAVLAWLGVFVMPCTVFASVTSIDTSAEIGESHGNCHGSHPSAATASDECCCDLPGISSGEAPKAEKVSAVVAIPNVRTDFQSLLAPGKVDMQHGPPPIEYSPPVYLSTQRLRI